MSTSSSTPRCIQFSFKEIKEATYQFDRSKILGHGGEATVYFAEIYIGSNKTPVAVKHLNDLKSKRDNSKEFKSEIQILSKIQHPNIVSLIGYCDESGHKILVYEYMANGCLSDYLKKKIPIALTWLQRLNICLDVARGLQHLHTETHEFSKGIIHRDVKPGNILVGENWVAKLSDFGMFKLSTAGQDKSSMATDRKGTSGYFAPEYHKLGCVTRKIDVYAFGVVLFQVLCRKMPWDREDESYYFDENEDLGIWAQKNVDGQIRKEMSEDSLTLFTDIIGRTMLANPGKRPTMDNVVLDLQKVLECSESENQPNQLDDTEEPTMDDLEWEESENRSKQLERFTRKCHQFSLAEIMAVTNEFDESQVLRMGGKAKVYIAEIYIGSNKTRVAVKLLHHKHLKEFETEIITLSKIQHPNLVSLIGYCNESGQKILVYEFMEMALLSDYLGNGIYVYFSWLKRLNVCLDVARGLQHLHKFETDEFPKGITHGGVNPGNILMGENFVCKLSGFDLFNLSRPYVETFLTIINRSIVGYDAPEYMMLGRVTRKTDVYSLGVVLFQVLCRKMPWDRKDDIYNLDENEDLGILAQENVDAQIRGEMSEESLTIFTDIIGRSLQKNPGERPTMDEVVLDLQKAVDCQECENLAKQLKDKDKHAEKLVTTKECPTPITQGFQSGKSLLSTSRSLVDLPYVYHPGSTRPASPPTFSMAHPLALQVQALDVEILRAEDHLLSLRNIRASIYTIMMDTFGHKEGDHATTESE